MHFFSPPVPILGTRYRTVLFPKLADAFLMMYQTAAVGIFTNIGAFGEFCHGNTVSIERVHSGDFGMEKTRKRRIFRRLQAPVTMAGAEGLEPSTRGFGGNVEISLTLQLFPDFGDLLPAAPLMIQELMLF